MTANISCVGLQLAGAHLKELQKAMNNPTANLGMIFDEGSRRMLRAVGLTSGKRNTLTSNHSATHLTRNLFPGPSLGDRVSPQLRDASILAAKCVDNFGSSVEYLLRKYNKNIIHQQFLLNRLANSAIDIFVMMVVLSRATRSITKDLYTAQHEINMTNVICNEVSS